MLDDLMSNSVILELEQSKYSNVFGSYNLVNGLYEHNN